MWRVWRLRARRGFDSGFLREWTRINTNSEGNFTAKNAKNTKGEFNHGWTQINTDGNSSRETSKPREGDFLQEQAKGAEGKRQGFLRELTRIDAN
jgi:hypothetical protein